MFDLTYLPNLRDELDKESSAEESKKIALCSALATILFRIFFTRSNPSGLCDRVSHFVSRQKSIKTRMGMGMGKKGKVRFLHLFPQFGFQQISNIYLFLFNRL